MGIVVTVFMLLALLILSPFSAVSLGKFRNKPEVVNQLAAGVFVAGLWNLLWYGLQNLQTFWGLAALISGIFMVLAASLILVEWGGQPWSSHAVIKKCYQVVKPIKWLVIIGLLACFTLYAITLIQLNLGYPILH